MFLNRSRAFEPLDIRAECKRNNFSNRTYWAEAEQQRTAKWDDYKTLSNNMLICSVLTSTFSVRVDLFTMIVYRENFDFILFKDWEW